MPDWKDALDSAKAIGRELKLPETFLEDLEREEDWAFSIKAAAVAEAVINDLLAEKAKPEVLELLAELSMGGPRGRRAFGVAFGVLAKTECLYLEALAELRNRAAHDLASCVRFSIADFVKEKQAAANGQFEQWAKKIVTFAGDGEFVLDGKKMNGIEFVSAEPRKAVWHGLISFLGIAQCGKQIRVAQKEIESLAAALRGLGIPNKV